MAPSSIFDVPGSSATCSGELNSNGAAAVAVSLVAPAEAGIPPTISGQVPSEMADAGPVGR